MKNNLDESFMKFYKSIILGSTNTGLSEIVNYSILSIYRHLTEKSIYNNPGIKLYKRLLYTYREKFKARNRIKKVLKNDKYNCLVVINETSHLKHAFALSKELKEFSPLFLTNKKRFLDTISKKFDTQNIIYIPKILFGKREFKTEKVKELFSELESASSHLDTITELLNTNYWNYKLTVTILNSIVKNNNIKFVYVFNDLLFTGRVIVDFFNKKDIKTFYLMHGLIYDELVTNLHICSKYLVFGEYSRKILAKQEFINQDDILILGAPYLREQEQAEQTPFFREHIVNHLPKDKKVALILLSGPGHSTSESHHKQIIDSLKYSLENENRYHFIFKLHNKDSPSYYDRLIEDDSVNNYDVYEFNYFQGKDTIFDWIKISDVIVTGSSSTALEAMYLGKPVVTIDLKNEYASDTEFIREGSTYHCKTKQEVSKTLVSLLENNFKVKSKSQEIVSQYFANSSNIQKFHQEVLTNI